MASSPGSRTLGFIASPPAVSRPCGLPFASVVSTFPAPSGRPKPHETSALMSIPGEELHTERIGFLPAGTGSRPDADRAARGAVRQHLRQNHLAELLERLLVAEKRRLVGRH